MSSKITYNVTNIDESITNPLVRASVAKDNTTPFSFLEFITITKIDYTPDEYNRFYIDYLKEWSDIKNSTLKNEKINFVDVYVQFLRELVLTYSTNQEKRFLAKLNFKKSADLDIAIPFFVDKIRQIILFYKDRRSEAQYVVERNKVRGSGLSIEKAIFEKIYEYVFAAQDSPSYSTLGITLSGLQANLKINIEEFADVYGNYFDPPPILRGGSQIINLDDAALPLIDNPNYIVVDNFNTASMLYDDSDQSLGDRDVYQSSTGIQTGTPVTGGVVVSNNSIIGVNTQPSIDITNPSVITPQGRTLGYIPPGTPMPTGNIIIDTDPAGTGVTIEGTGLPITATDEGTNTTTTTSPGADAFSLSDSVIVNGEITDIQAASLTGSLADIQAAIATGSLPDLQAAVLAGGNISSIQETALAEALSSILEAISNGTITAVQGAALASSISGGIFTDLQGNIISNNTNIPNTTPGIVLQPGSEIQPILTQNDGLIDQVNNTNNNPIDPRLYFPDDTYSDIFGSTAFLEGLPLIANVDLKYDPICDPNNPIDIAKRDQEQKTGLTSRQVVDLKRKLLSKYMGVDFYYIDTTGTVPVSGVLLTADSPSSNIPNLQLASTPTVPGTQILLASNPVDTKNIFPVDITTPLSDTGNNTGTAALPDGLNNSGVVSILPNGVTNNTGVITPLNAENNGGVVVLPGGQTLIPGSQTLIPGGQGGGQGGGQVTTTNGQNRPLGNNSGGGTILTGLDINSDITFNPNLDRGQQLNIVDNRTNSDLTFGGGDQINDFGFLETDTDRSGTYYAADVKGTPIESTFRDNSLNDSIKLLRNIGLFFKPDKVGLFKLNAKNFSYTIDYNKLEPQKLYIFPDPNVYGNVSVNAQDEYPIVYIYDHRPDVKDISSGFAYGDPLVAGDEQAFGPYYTREQNNEKQLTGIDGLNLNFTDLSNLGYIAKMQNDVFGNEYALFKDELGQTFRNREELSSDRVVSKVLNGHVFYDNDEGYNFNYGTVDVIDTTIRSGLSTSTVDMLSSDNTWRFTVSAQPMTFFFREFVLYQELLQETRRILPAFRDCGRFTFLDSEDLPDPLGGDEYAYPASSNYYYELLVDAGIASVADLKPPRPAKRSINIEDPPFVESPPEVPLNTETEYILETDQTFADFTIDVRLFLSAGNVKDYDCGYFTDNLTLQNDYNYSTNYDYYDVVSDESMTVLSQLSATHDYITQGEREKLAGQFYVKNQAYSLSQPVSTGLDATIGKYSAQVRSEIYNSTQDFEIIYDTLIVETPSYLIFDKIKYDNDVFEQPGTRNTVFKILTSSTLNRFSNRFFHENKRSIMFAILSPFTYTGDILSTADLKNIPIITQEESPIITEKIPPRYQPIYAEETRGANIDIEEEVITTTYTGTVTLSSGNNKVIVPNIYEYNIKQNTYNKIFPLNTQLQDLSGLFSLQNHFDSTGSFSIVEVKKPILTYNSLNDIYKLTYIGMDNNNLFHLFDYSFFINNEGAVIFNKGNYYKHDKIVRTSDLMSTETTFISAYRIAGDFTVSKGKLIL